MTLTTKEILVNYVSNAGTLRAFLESIVGLPNNPPSLYLSTDSCSLIAYVEPILTLNVIDLSGLREAILERSESAVRLKHILEIEPTRKAYTSQTYVHEVQMMEIALRQSDSHCEWLARFDTCIDRDSRLNTSTFSFKGVRGNGFDKRILHLPFLWKKYHDQLTTRSQWGMGFWISMIREATQKRLEAPRTENNSMNGPRSGWDLEFIEDQTESWNNDVEMDAYTNGEWLGGQEYWARFEVL
ncbi:hypothetical protein COCC4DRAFT_134240 [Bipolaris maydis ATCC 48331]|nr:uncharacterized protein COCC4DRAFT_134240 [Bipolaris maydis ATCC 48331]ENI06505.1 hypothetical protein COCC4DRAFT_134240 [Bipolaris maydis ATCC 48331]KAJ6266811.1 hypothetical protein PSV08DRAFT_373819 [Bipolaris maydis]KAJ6277428.1 hypothetical protein J3E71DRAFT_364820 [Bipolaris maydis]